MNRRMDETYLARGPVQVCVPLLAEVLHGSGVFESAHYYVMKERVSAVEETGECTVQCTQYVLRQSLCISLPLSLCEYNPFQSTGTS